MGHALATAQLPSIITVFAYDLTQILAKLLLDLLVILGLDDLAPQRLDLCLL